MRTAKTPETTALCVNSATRGARELPLQHGHRGRAHQPTHWFPEPHSTAAPVWVAPRGAPLSAGPAAGPRLCVCSGRGSQSGEGRGRGWAGGRGPGPQPRGWAGRGGSGFSGAPGGPWRAGRVPGSNDHLSRDLSLVTRGPSQGQAVACWSRRGWGAALWSQGAEPVRGSGSGPVPPRGWVSCGPAGRHHGVVLLAGAGQRPRWRVASSGQGRGACGGVSRVVPELSDSRSVPLVSVGPRGEPSHREASLLRRAVILR